MLWITPAIDPSYGGPSTTTFNSVLAEARSGIDVTLAFTVPSTVEGELKDSIDQLRSAGATLVAFPRASQARWAATWGISLPLIRWLWSNIGRFDVVSLQYIWAATSVFGALFARLRSVPATLTPHESLTKFDIDVTSNGRPKRMLKLTIRQLVLRCVSLVQFSSALEQTDSPVLDSTQTTITRFPVVDSIDLDADPSEPHGEAIQLGFLGRLHPKKNLELCISVLSYLDPRVRLVIGGTGDSTYEDSLEAHALAEGVDSRITWLGQVPRAQRSQFFASVDVLLMPSRYESFGMVTAEALAAGVPVVLGPRAGIADVVEARGAGVVLRELSAEAIADGLDGLLEAPGAWSSASMAGRRAARDCFSFNSYVEQVDPIYTHLSTSGRGVMDARSRNSTVHSGKLADSYSGPLSSSERQPNDPISVLRVIPTIDPDVGGPSHSAVNAVLAETGGQVDSELLISSSGALSNQMKATLEALVAVGVPINLLPRSRRLSGKRGTWGASVRLLIWLVRQVPHYDILHLHYVWSLTTLVGSLRAFSAGIPVVLTAHESLTHYDIDITSGSWFKRQLKLALRRVIVPKVSVIVCASKLELQDSLSPGETGVVIAHPVLPLANFEHSPHDDEHFTLAFLGRLHPKKGLERLLDALSQQDPRVRLLICGTGEDAYVHSLQEKAHELGLSHRVEWRGHVDESGKRDLLAAADWLVMPSDYECFGMSAAEAIASKVPVIVSSSAGMASIVERYSCGLVVDTSSPETLVRAIKYASTRAADEKTTFQENTLKARDNALSPAAYRDQITQLYKKLAPSPLTESIQSPTKKTPHVDS